MVAWSRVAIIQAYVPSYRREFFERLIERLRADRIECFVVAGKPLGDQAVRGDAIEAPWIRYVEPRSIKLGSRRLNLGGSAKAWKDADALVVGLLGSSIDTYSAVLSGIRGQVRVGLWGHVKAYTSRSNKADLALERWQMRHADRVFAYTPSGASAALAAGIPSSKVTTLMNSIDTDALGTAIADLTETQVIEFMTRFNLQSGRVLAYVGGLDTAKRIEFLSQSIDELYRIAPEIKVVVAGRGSQAALLQASIDRGQVIGLGYAGDTEKALLGRAATAFLNPGRIGLLAVEALMLRVPIITTVWPFHGPEEEYLIEGTSKFIAPNTPSDYASYVSQFCDRPRVEGEAWIYPTMDDMVANFRAGVLLMLQDHAPLLSKPRI
jgi:glycosyltransferase involved in cell wall biosynthesis